MMKIEHNDNPSFEVKEASGGFPETALDTISAFCNTPGGGTLIFGVSEKLGFEIVGVYDANQCQQTLRNHASSSFSSRVDTQVSAHEFLGKTVICARIKESDTSLKPVEIRSSGKAYIRILDGDYELSSIEKQLFIANRGQSRFDMSAVEATSIEDLDKSLLEKYLVSRRDSSSALRGYDDNELLIRTSVITASGELTKAGACALGKYPQQYCPNYSIRASVRSKDRTALNVRAVNAKTFDGPIPTILEDALKWVRDNSDELILNTPSGHVVSVQEFPLAVVRELLTNALVHRDLNPLSLIQDISLIIEDGRLIISNPGGLYAVTLSELGKTGSRTRNSMLAEICQHVRTSNGQRIIEKLGSGIPKILSEIANLGMKPPRFIDGGIYFTAILESGKVSINKNSVEGSGNSNEEKILLALSSKAMSRQELESFAKLTTNQARYALKKLVNAKKVVIIGPSNSAKAKYCLASQENNSDYLA